MILLMTLIFAVDSNEMIISSDGNNLFALRRRFVSDWFLAFWLQDRENMPQGSCCFQGTDAKGGEKFGDKESFRLSFSKFQ